MKKSPFNTIQQQQSVESKIVVALERVAEAFRVLLWNTGKEASLSPIQVQLLIFLLFHSRDQSKVSYLAAEFNMTKATVSDSIKSLLQKNLVEKYADTDSRSFTIGLTADGKKIARQASLFASAIGKPLASFSNEQKEVMLNGLLTLIRELNQAGIITIQRMCYSCANYRHENDTHYCTLLEKKLAGNEIRVDCPEHEFA